MIWFTSDTHFNHVNIISFCQRPWRTVDEMNAGLIERWNATVAPGDTVFHLGDFAMGKHDDAPAIFDLLHGQKHLIVGNHDSTKTKRMGWASVEAKNMLCDEDGHLLMVHNPDHAMAMWAPAVVLHGHLHGMTDLHPFTKHPHIRYIDVGVDCWDYRPISLDQIKALTP